MPTRAAAHRNFGMCVNRLGWACLSCVPAPQSISPRHRPTLRTPLRRPPQVIPTPLTPPRHPIPIPPPPPPPPNPRQHTQPPDHRPIRHAHPDRILHVIRPPRPPVLP